VASSTSEKRAQEFITEVGADKQSDGTKAVAYGSYDEFVKDKNIDIVYVATQHSHHYENVLTCLEAGKNVCCEVRPVGRCEQGIQGD
jgi:dihydrodiol dehydrogenase / D-xylose 1-dehydrogenase (NADP)